MPERRDRDDAIAAELERVADALRGGEAAVYSYDVQRKPNPAQTGGISYPGGWFEFRFEGPAAAGRRPGADGRPDEPGPQE